MTQRTKNSSNRTKEQREQDLVTTAKLRLEGYNQFEISKRLSVSQQQVSADLKELRRQWRFRTEHEATRLMDEEIAKIDRVERTHWQGYWQSIQTREIIDGESGKRHKVPVDGGDPRFLQGVERCIAKRAELMGIMPPSKIAPTTPDGKEQYSGVLVVPGLQTTEQWLANDDSPEDDSA